MNLNTFGGITAKTGVALTGLLEICNRWDLLDISFSTGAAISGETIVRNENLLCTDAGLHLYGEFSAMDEGVIGNWLNIGYSLDFWDSNNSPLKFKLHSENFILVNECTYQVEKGSLAGMVAKASDRRIPIKDAVINAYQRNNSEVVNSTKTDNYGNYLMNLQTGDYIIQISAPGYMTFEYNITIMKNEEKYAETFLMIDEGQEGQLGQATGKVVNAMTGEGIANAVIKLRIGWKKLDGDIIVTAQTDQSGRYQVNTSIGNYTLIVEQEGYITNTKNIVILSESLTDQNITKNPVSEEIEPANLRIVLTWGERPKDLDSHLLGPTIDGNDYFHVYFANKRYIENFEKIADLDIDDTFFYGPETTSLYQKNPSGTYSFYVHDYSNRANRESMELSQSEAIVEVYLDGSFYKAYPVPSGQTGVNWHVFDYDAATNTIKDINKFVEEIAYEDQHNNIFTVVPMDTTK